MDIKNICPRCMREKPRPEVICPFCGRSPGVRTAPPHALANGTVLMGRYLTGDILEEEDFHISYAGYDLQDDRRVSVREFFFRGGMQRVTAHSADVRIPEGAYELDQTIAVCEEKFESEARQIMEAGGLPGIARVYDVFYENRTVYIIQEYPDGVTLGEYVRDHGPMPFDLVLKNMTPVMHSLSLLHEMQILHCDIRPGNLIAGPDGGLKLFDFGGAKMLGRYDGLKSAADDEENSYTPVEQLFHEELQPSADEYALAAVIYFAVTGTDPQDARSRADKDMLPRPSSIGADIGKNEEDVLMKAMSVRRSGRYRTVSAFEAALENAAAGRPAPRDPDDRKHSRKVWLLTFVVAAVILLVLIAAVLFLELFEPPADVSALRMQEMSGPSAAPLISSLFRGVR